MVEHLFRHEAGKMVATLTRIFGLEHLTRAEDVVQANSRPGAANLALLWRPESPAGWIMRASRWKLFYETL